MKKGTDGIWRTQAVLTPGEHHYRFIVDGVWKDDPECTIRVKNPFGTSDSVVRVSPAV